MFPSVVAMDSGGIPIHKLEVLLQELPQLGYPPPQAPSDPMNLASCLMHLAHMPQRLQQQDTTALLAQAPRLMQIMGAVVVLKLGWAQCGPAAQGAELAVLQVLSQGPTWHPFCAALIGTGHPLERA